MIKEVKFTRATEADKTFATYLREVADRLEKGEIRDIVVVLDDGENSTFEANTKFKDRWRMLGALEYARNAVHNG